MIMNLVKFYSNKVSKHGMTSSSNKIGEKVARVRVDGVVKIKPRDVWIVTERLFMGT